MGCLVGGSVFPSRDNGRMPTESQEAGEAQSLPNGLLRHIRGMARLGRLDRRRNPYSLSSGQGLFDIG
jgi:hypothetical protein